MADEPDARPMPAPSSGASRASPIRTRAWIYALLGVLGAAVGVTVLLVVAGMSLHGPALRQPISYWLAGPTTLGVLVVSGPPASYRCAIVQTVEDSSQVQIDAVCQPPVFSLGGSAVGYPYLFDVPLTSPLDDRRVVDGLDNPATLCAQSRCGLSPQ